VPRGSFQANVRSSLGDGIKKPTDAWRRESNAQSAMKTLAPVWWASNDDSSKDSIDVILETQMERRKSEFTKDFEPKVKNVHSPIDKTVMIIPMSTKAKKDSTSGFGKHNNAGAHKKAAHRNSHRLISQSIQSSTPTYMKKAESKLKSLLDRDKKEHAKANKVK
jgi:hypothetical protein